MAYSSSRYFPVEYFTYGYFGGAPVEVEPPGVPIQEAEPTPWWRREPVSYSAEMYRLVPSFLNLDNPLGDVIDHHYEYEILPNGKKIPAKPRTIPYPQR